MESLFSFARTRKAKLYKCIAMAAKSISLLSSVALLRSERMNIRQDALTRKEMASVLGIGTRTLDKLVHDKEIPSFFIRGSRRFDPAAVLAALKGEKDGK